MTKLKEQTLQLITYLDELKVIYEKNCPPGNLNDKVFFLQMKKETAEIYHLLEKWEKNGLDFVKDKKVNVHPHQIASTRENIELLVLHSYYVDAKRKRYMELNHSCHYIFDLLLADISNRAIERGK